MSFGEEDPSCWLSISVDGLRLPSANSEACRMNFAALLGLPRMRTRGVSRYALSAPDYSSSPLCIRSPARHDDP